MSCVTAVQWWHVSVQPSPQPSSTPVLMSALPSLQHIIATHHRLASSSRIITAHHRSSSSSRIIAAHHCRASSRFLVCMDVHTPYTCSVHVLSETAYLWDGTFFGGFAAALATLAVGNQLTERIRDGDQVHRPVICTRNRCSQHEGSEQQKGGGNLRGRFPRLRGQPLNASQGGWTFRPRHSTAPFAAESEVAGGSCWAVGWRSTQTCVVHQPPSYVACRLAVLLGARGRRALDGFKPCGLRLARLLVRARWPFAKGRLSVCGREESLSLRSG